MYETEINTSILPKNELPDFIISQILKHRLLVQSKTTLFWGEHCTECAVPHCYATCQLYHQRPIDGKCRRFEHGMQRYDIDKDNYFLKVNFKKWAQLWSPANTQLIEIEKIADNEKKDFLTAKIIQKIPFGHLKKYFATTQYHTKKHKIIDQKNTPNSKKPNTFLVETYNPNQKPINFTLIIRSSIKPSEQFQHAIDVNNGYNFCLIDTKDIEQMVNLTEPFSAFLIPNNADATDDFWFGWIDFVAFKNHLKTPKCIVWDLDNTLWDGILVEQTDISNLTLKPNIKNLLQRLDECGVLQSIASKNNHEHAKNALKYFGIDHFFLYPEINWQPKSVAVQRIAKNLNIGIESLLFIDDSTFERAEVKQNNPQIEVLDAANYFVINDLPIFSQTISTDAKNRRVLYQQNENRQQNAPQFGKNYLDFLKNCHINMTIKTLNVGNLQRAFELAQRTNQMNFSGNRYSFEALEATKNNPNLTIFVMDCSDKFGDYGTIGLAIFDVENNQLIDLMFSCRVQSKCIEHRFLSFLMEKYTQNITIKYNQTEKNTPAGQVFYDFNFKILTHIGNNFVFETNTSNQKIYDFITINA